jgi:hypothetical protein
MLTRALVDMLVFTPSRAREELQQRVLEWVPSVDRGAGAQVSHTSACSNALLLSFYECSCTCMRTAS